MIPDFDRLEKNSNYWMSEDGTKYIPLMNRYLESEQIIAAQSIQILF